MPVSSGNPAGRENKTILVVDDEPMVLGLVRNMLRREGYNVLEANDGNEALKLVSDPERQINLLLTDIVMPAMNGYQLADRVKIQRSDIKILFMSGYQDRVIADLTGLSVEVTPLIRKPFTQHNLSVKIAEMLSESTHPAATSDR